MPRFQLVLVLVCLSGCDALIQVPNPTPGEQPNPNPSPIMPCVQSGAAPRARIYRLTQPELSASLTSLLGQAPSSPVPADATALGFSNPDSQSVTSAFAEALKVTGETAGAALRPTVVSPKFPASCFTTEAAARTCADTFIRDTARRAFRRPVLPRELTALLEVYDIGRDVGTVGAVADRFRFGLDYSLRAIVQSPHFIYRTELGEMAAAGAATRLTPFELAAAISYAVTGGPPDEALSQAAENGALVSREAVAAQVKRLTSAQLEAFKTRNQRFVTEWLDIDFNRPEWAKNTTVYPLYSAPLKEVLRRETQLTVDDWIATGPTLEALLTRTDTFINATNAPVYGLTSTSTEFLKMALDPRQRAGILTFAGFLGTQAHTDASSPILRGVRLKSRVLCTPPPNPPANIIPLPPVAAQQGRTTRERVENHLASGGASCQGCHTQFNPLGYPFESYDGLGVFRTQENGAPVDSSGAIVGTATSNQKVADAVALMTALAASREVQHCFAQQVFRSSMGRLETEFDRCAIAEAAREGDLRDVLASIVASTSFNTRLTPSEP